MDYRQLIKSKFEEKTKKNSHYSLRSFAKHLGLSNGFLSRVLNGKRALTLNKAVLVAEHLGLDASTKELFMKSVALDLSQKYTRKYIDEIQRLEKAFKEELRLKADEYLAISDWYHSSIIELTNLPNFCEDPKWISQMLKITELEAAVALERLVTIGMLVRNKQGKLQKQKLFSAFKSDHKSQALKNLHSQWLDKAKLSIDQTPRELRELNCITMAIHPDRMKAAKERIEKFKINMCKFLTAGSDPTQVYTLSLQLFPVSEELKKTGTK